MEKTDSANFNNKRKILSKLKSNNQFSRIDLSRELNITKASITNITNEFIRQGIVYESGIAQEANARGRKKINLCLNENYKFALGATITKNKISVGLSTLKGQLIDKVSIPMLEKTYRDVLSDIVNAIQQIIRNNCLEEEKILGLGVCVAQNVVDLIDGNDKFLKIKRDLSHALDIPIVAVPLSMGVFVAQENLSDSYDSKGLNLFILYGQEISSCLYFNNSIYMPQQSRPFGFDALQQKYGDNRYVKYQQDLSQCEDENQKIKIREQFESDLANDIALCDLMMVPDSIYVLGDYFDEEVNIQKINSKLKGISLKGAFVKGEKICVAGFAIAIEQFFYQTAGN